MSSEKYKPLIAALLKVAKMQDHEGREDVISDLPERIRNAIDYRASSGEHVRQIVLTCANFAGGLEKLFESLEYLDGGSIQFLNAQTEFEKIQEALAIESGYLSADGIFREKKGITYFQIARQIDQILNDYLRRCGIQPRDILKQDEWIITESGQNEHFKFPVSRLQQLRCNRDEILDEFLEHFLGDHQRRPLHFFVLRSELSQQPLSFTERALLELTDKFGKSVFHPRLGENNRQGARLHTVDFPNGRRSKLHQHNLKKELSDCLKAELLTCNSLDELYQKPQPFRHRREDYLAVTLKIRSSQWCSETYNFCNWFLTNFCNAPENISPKLIFFLYVQIEKKDSRAMPWPLNRWQSSPIDLLDKELLRLKSENPWIHIFDRHLEAPILGDLKDWLTLYIKYAPYRRQIINTFLARNRDELAQALRAEDYAMPDDHPLDMSDIEIVINAVYNAFQPPIIPRAM